MNDRIKPWDQRMAGLIAGPPSKTAVTPNQITAVSLASCLIGSALMATGAPAAMDTGAGLFVLGRFLDHLDGELAGLTGKKTRFGYYFDYAAIGMSYAAFFAGVGLGLSTGVLGGWSLLLGLAGSAAAIVSLFLNLAIDRAQEDVDVEQGEAIGYPSLAGFELEDGIYLVAPITWLGFLQPFFIAAGLGATVYCLWTLWRLTGLRSQGRSP